MRILGLELTSNFFPFRFIVFIANRTCYNVQSCLLNIFPKSTNQLAVLLTECCTANQILTECCMGITGNLPYINRQSQCQHALLCQYCTLLILHNIHNYNADCIIQIDGYVCHCEPGYEGIHCEHDVDECLSHPCHNGATCKDLINEWHCVCHSGFEGMCQGWGHY